MLGFQIFHNIYLNLSLKGKNIFLGNIFGIDDVSVSDFLIMKNKIIIRLFSQNVFYQSAAALSTVSRNIKQKQEGF